MNRTLKIAFFFLLALFIFPSSPLLANPLTEDVVTNYYVTYLPRGDRGTVYLDSDHRFNILPAFDNKYYVHICTGSWSFNEKRQILSLKRAKKCRAMKGNYQVHLKKDDLYLVDGTKVRIFRHLEQM